MILAEMDKIYSTLNDEGFSLSSASYEKDDYHVFYKSGLVLTMDLSTPDVDATMMYFDSNGEFVSYTYDLPTPESFEDLLEHVLNVIETNSVKLKWDLNLYEIIHLDKLIFVSKKDLENTSSEDNLDNLKIERIMNFDRPLFNMIVGFGDDKNKFTILYDKLSTEGFKIMLIERSNTGIANITRALFRKDGVLIVLFYEESGVILCGNIYFETSKPISDNLYIDDDNILNKFDLDEDNNSKDFILYKVKFSETTLKTVLYLMNNTDIIHSKMCKGAYESINLVNSTTYLANKYHKHLKSIAEELSNEDLEALGMK